MNNISIIGRIGNEIALKYLPSGSAIANFSIAVNQDYKDKNGQKVEKTSWFDITSFGKTAENVNQFFGKGSNIGISGELDQQTWQDNQGQKRSKVIIKLNSFTFIDKRENNQGSYNNQNNYQQQNQQQVQHNQQKANGYQPQQDYSNQQQININDDEIPF